MTSPFMLQCLNLKMRLSILTVDFNMDDSLRCWPNINSTDIRERNDSEECDEEEVQDASELSADLESVIMDLKQRLDEGDPQLCSGVRTFIVRYNTMAKSHGSNAWLQHSIALVHNIILEQ